MTDKYVSCSGGERFADPLPVGAPAPDFEIGAASGGPTLLSDLRGQTVVLVFSAPGWDPSRAEQTAQYERVLALAPHVRSAIVDVGGGESAGRGSPPVFGGIDPTGEVAAIYGVAGYGALFVVDDAGKICWRHVSGAGGAPNPDALLSALNSAAQQTGAGWRSLTRRQFVAAALGAAFVLCLPRASRSDDPAAIASASAAEPGAPAGGGVQATLIVNGESRTLALDPRTTLLDALRERLGLTGSKKGCDHGQCGACTVHLDGRRVNSCLILAIAAQGRHIVTIEGLAHGAELTALQTAFIEHDAFQCGYCTPGQLMSATALVHEDVGSSDDDVRVAMSGNLCRCGAYPNIVDAVQSVRKGAGNGSV